MKKNSYKLFLVILSILVIIVVVYFYLTIHREIKIFEEYQVSSKEETGGIVWCIIDSDESKKIQSKDYDLKIPEINFDDYYLLWSNGRRVKKITYQLISKFNWRYKVPKGIATLSEEYYPHTAFFYKIEKNLVKQDWLERDALAKKMNKIISE